MKEGCCFYCHETGNLQQNCPKLLSKPANTETTKFDLNVQAVQVESSIVELPDNYTVQSLEKSHYHCSCYIPF